jgi:UDP:flavonoid glycosyltransferase YjiC (YdhE family)
MVNRLAWTAVRTVLRQLDTMLQEQYLRLGAPPRGDAAILGTYSELLTIGLWSPAFFRRPNDWPDWFQIGGYARWDAPQPLAALGPALPAGDGPLIVFTLGSSVVNDPRGYYETALEAIRPTHWRAVLLGAPDDYEVPRDMASRVVAMRYACYSDLFPVASAIVHQGGVGTTQAACYYGVPAIVVPRGFDQFENAAHIQRHRLGLRIMPSSLTPTLLRIRLERLLSSDKVHRNVHRLSHRMQAEPGATASADLVEMALDPGFHRLRRHKPPHRELALV